MRLSILFLVLCLPTAFLHAAPPTVDHLFPPGGQRGTTVNVQVTGKLSAGTQAWCNRDDLKIAVDAKAKMLSVTIPKDAVPGLCWIRLHNKDGASPMKAFLIGTLPEVAEKETNDRLDQAQKLKSSSVVINGKVVKSGDVDTFAVNLKKGQTLVASVTANNIIGSPMDAVLQVVSPRGFVLQQNDDSHGFDPQTAFTALADGTYYVRTFAFPAKPNSSVRLSGAADYLYRLTVTTGPFLDYPYPLAVSQKESTEIKLRGWNLDSLKNGLELPPAGDEDEIVVHHPTLANWFPVAAVPHDSLVEQEPNTERKPQLVKLPVTVSGTIGEPRDMDVFAFSAKKGQRLEFRIEARALGSPLDPVLELYDDSGKSIGRAETRSSTNIDETLAVTLRADGRYRLTVSDLHRRGGWRFFYRLTMKQAAVGYELSVKTDRFTGAKSITIPVTVARDRGYRDEVNVAVEGLPKEVTAKVVQSKTKGATAKAVNLVLTAKAGYLWSGPIRIVGRDTANADLRRVAKAPIDGTTITTRDVWLTVSPTAAKSKTKKKSK